jgi:DNA helicase-2/ATP-dependent DNA helicase PcrA
MALAAEDGGYDTVSSVHPTMLDRPVFDLDIDRTHNFVANGIVTHNCIYSWRGAQKRNILAFGERFPAHARIVLGRNFRCRSEILDAAVACVAHNLQREAKALIAMRGAGGQVRVIAYSSDRHEADSLADAIAQALAGGIAAGEVLVLARTGYATGPLQAALARAGIPHRVLGSLGLYERSEVRDALAYLALLGNPADAQAFKRAIGSPRRGVGAATANHVVTLARESHQGDLIAASTDPNLIDSIRTGAIRDGLRRFGEGLECARRELSDGRSLGHVVVVAMMLDGGLVQHHQKRRDNSPKPDERQDAERVLEDLRSLCRAAQAYAEQQGESATLTGFLEQAAGLHAHEIAAGEPDRRITISTIHRAKGTEARLVVLLGCEERLLPSWRALAAPDGEQLAEERRLFYVACTRAKDQLILTHAAARGGRPTAGPSSFLAEAGLIDPSQALAA